LKNKKTLILIFALALVATACSGTATPCDEVDITTGDNGLQILVDVNLHLLSRRILTI
jgi:hypothetical protein